MEYRPLGKGGPDVSVICVGCWQFSRPQAYGMEDADSERTVHKALDLGINFFDVADSYGFGHAETVLARALGRRRSQVMIASKAGQEFTDRGLVGLNGRPDYLVQACERSLKRLGTDYLDLFYIHWPDPKVPVEESWGGVQRLIEQGKVRWGGVSNFNLRQLQACHRLAPITAAQPPFSLVDRRYAAEENSWCAENGVAVCAYSPLGSGLLSGKYRPGDPPPAFSDWRAHWKWFQAEHFPAYLKLAGRLMEVGAQHGKSLSQVALAWVLQQPGLTSAITGVRRPEHIAEHAGAAGWRLSEAELQEIENWLPS